MIPFPFVISEIIIFFLAVDHWGFFDTLGLYFLPSLLGLIILSVAGRISIMNLQSSVMRGELPANKMLHSGAIFVSGILFVIPSFFTRVFAVILILPGLRHLAIWFFKKKMAQQISKGGSGFGSKGFGFGNGNFGGFQYYEFRNNGQGFEGKSTEREVYENNVLDVTPIKVTHEGSKKDDNKG